MSGSRPSAAPAGLRSRQAAKGCGPFAAHARCQARIPASVSGAQLLRRGFIPGEGGAGAFYPLWSERVWM